MRRGCWGVLLAVATALPIGLIAAPAGAITGTYCATSSGTETYSPTVPMVGDPTKVTPTVTATLTFGGCVGFGATRGTAVYTGKYTGPVNCAMIRAGTDPDLVGTEVISWDNGQKSTLAIRSDFIIDSDRGSSAVTAGLLSGAGYTVTYEFPNACVSGRLATLSLLDAFDQPEFTPAKSATASCQAPKACESAAAATATATAPGLTASVVGTPAAGTATTHLSIAAGTLACPKVPPTVRPVADLTDTGFTPNDRLTVTAALPSTSSTSAEQVCFNSAIPFKSQSNPTLAKAGTDFLLNCTQVANAPPCVLSSKKQGTDVLVTFVVPGGDPRFSIVVPTGRQVWLLFPPATKGRPWSAHLHSSGGVAPVSWKVSSGALPNGCALNAKTGVIAGTPTVSGKFKAVVQAADSEKPPKTATISVPITVD